MDDGSRPSMHLEGVFLHSGHDVLEQDLCGQCVAVVDDWLHVGAIPAVDLEAAAAFPQRTSTRTHTQMDAHMQRKQEQSNFGIIRIL